ncbi:MAG: GxxExxY protein [Nitrospirae bacterium]|nr:GxxExxY protein [Nitrospirota bacterium]
MNTDRLKHKDITDVVLKGFYEIYNELGEGFLESVYENALYIVLNGYGMSIERQRDIPVYFRGNIIGDFKADMIVNGRVVVELKAVSTLDPAHEAQLINYLKATNIEVGLLLNFGKKPEFKRFVYDNKKNISDNPRKSVAKI